MNNKKTIVMSTLLLAIVLLGIGTIAYFRRTVNGNITGEAGNLVLIVNEANAVDNETFEIILKRSEEENFIMPDDSGVFDLNIDSTGSSSDVAVSITISRTNLPENLKFYSDEKHTNEIINYGTVIKKSADMTKTVPVYWFWDGSISDEDDSEFINQTISANISVSASIAKTLWDTLLAMDYTLDINVDFSLEASETNGQGLMMRDGTVTQEYPIIYYRGNVANNNVIYAGYCWLIVRTTETGGVKLIYNGEINTDGSCSNFSGVGDGRNDNSDNSPIIGMSEFNDYYKSAVYVGYMYNDSNDYYSLDTLTFDTNGYKLHLLDNTIDSETRRHNQNLKSSVVKETIDDWYVANIEGKAGENLLEDTIWCNDRSVIDENYSMENFANGTYRYFNFAAGTRLNGDIDLSLMCSRDMDKFTVDSENGNGDLTHPIGMLTTDEIAFAGKSGGYSFEPCYLDTNDPVWTLSPSSLLDNEVSASVFGMDYVYFGGDQVNNYRGVRPAISLKNSTIVTSGNGTFENPYTVG